MKKFIAGLGIAALSLVGISTAASANIDGIDVDWDRDFTKTVVEFCVSVDLTDDEVDNPEYRVLRTKLYTSSLTAVVSVDEGALGDEGIDLNNDGDVLDEFTATYVQYENWLKTEGEGSSLTIVDTNTGETVVLSIGEEFTIEDFEEVRGLALTDEPCQAGPTGPQGPAGADGQDGTDGANGADGAQGPAGPAGPAGQTVVIERTAPAPVAAPVALPRTS